MAFVPPDAYLVLLYVTDMRNGRTSEEIRPFRLLLLRDVPDQIRLVSDPGTLEDGRPASLSLSSNSAAPGVRKLGSSHRSLVCLHS